MYSSTEACHLSHDADPFAARTCVLGDASMKLEHKLNNILCATSPVIPTHCGAVLAGPDSGFALAE